MNGILKQMKKIKHALAVMLCMALLLEGTGMQVLAETTSDVLNDVAAVSDVENASSGGTTDGGTIDGEEDEPESDAPVMASGNYCEGVTWTLYEDGLLVVKGTAAEGVRSYTRGWCNDGYQMYVKSAKVQVKGVTSLRSFFYDCYNLETVDFTGSDTSSVTDMSWMFYACHNLVELDLSGFDTGNVTNMGTMFYECYSLSNLNLSGLNTKNVTDVSSMFIRCYDLSTLDLSSFDFSSVTTGSSMLSEVNIQTLETPRNLTIDIQLNSDTMYDSNGTSYNKLPVGMETSVTLTSRCYFDDYEETEKVEKSGTCCEGVTWTLTNKGHLVIEGNAVDGEAGSYSSLCNGWTSYKDYIVSAEVKVTGVTSFANLFNGCKNLESVDFTGSDTADLTDMSGLFNGCKNLKSLNLSGLATGNVTDMSFMFKTCCSLKSLDLNGLAAENVVNMSSMFSDCSSLESLDLSSLKTDNVTDMTRMFYGCSNLGSLDLSGFVTSNAIDMSTMFYGCHSLSGLDLSNFDTKNVTDMGAMFSFCSNLTELNLSRFVTSNVTDMSAMFQKCSNLQSLDLSGFEAKNVTDMGNMFYGCSNLQSLDLSNFDTSNIKSMGYMFYGCSNLKKLALSSFNTINVTSMSCMFNGCSNLQSLDLSSFDTSNVTDMGSMFYGCSSLKKLDLSSFDISKVTNKWWNIFVDCDKLEVLDLSGFDMSNNTSDAVNVYSLKNLKILNTPKNLSTTKYLPVTMYDKSGNAYTALPIGLTESIILVSDMSIFDELEKEEETPGGDVSDGDVSDGDVTGGDVPGGDVTGGDVSSGDTNDGNDKPESGDTNDGNDKPESGDTTDGNDKPEGGDTNGGNDTPEGGDTTDGNDKTEGGDTNDTTDGDDKTEDDKEDDNTGDSDASEDEDIPRVLAIEPIADQFYTGKALKPEVIVTYGKDVLSLGKDYTVSYKNNINAAKADSAKAPVAIVKGKGNFEGTITVAFNIIAKELTESNTDISEMLSYESGAKQTVKPTVKLSGKKLAEGKDYTIEYTDQAEGAYEKPGTYNVMVKGMNNYQGSVVAAMTVLSENQVMASKLKVGKIAACDYKENEPVTPSPAVSYKGKELVPGKDYAISYKNNDRAGKATLLITGLKNTDAEGTYVAGTLKKTFTVNGTPLKKASVNYEQKVNYTGAAICPKVTLTMDGKDLTLGKDYTVEYTKNVNVGKATILLTGQGGYTGTVKKTFAIQADASVADKLAVSFAGGKAEASYSAKGAKPSVTVALGDITLKAGKDYTVSYKNNKKLAEVNATKAPTVLIKGKGNYKFTKSVTFAIVQKNMADADMSIASADKFVGSKKGYISAPVIKDENGKKLKLNKDYKIVSYTVNGEVFDGAGEVTAGTVVTVTVQGEGNYVGTDTTTYRVANNDISKTKVNKPQLEYNGGRVKFTEEMLKEGKLEITDKATGKKLVYGTDFIVTGYKNNTKKGTATVTVQGIGEYGGTKAVKFSIVSKKMEKK